MQPENIKSPPLSVMAQAYINADYNSREREDENEDAILEPQMPAPDTDNEIVICFFDGKNHLVVDANFARKLERRLAVSRIRVERLRQALSYLKILGTDTYIPNIDSTTMSCHTETQVRQVWNDGTSIIIDSISGRNLIAEGGVSERKTTENSDEFWVCDKCGDITNMKLNVCCHCGARKPKEI